MGLFDAIIGSIPIVGGIYNSVKADNARKDENRRAAESTEEQHQYEVDVWERNIKKVEANQAYEERKARETYDYNVRKADLVDEVARRKYDQQLKIRDLEIKSADEQFGYAEAFYEAQVGFNEMKGMMAEEEEYARMAEVKYDNRIQLQDIALESIIATGKTKLKGGTRVARKLAQDEWAAVGRGEQILYDSLLAGTSDLGLKKIALDEFGANLRAEAQRKLKPLEIPEVTEPLPTTRSTLIMPRPLDPTFDFLPRPIKGVVPYKPSAVGTMGAVIGGATSISQNEWDAGKNLWNNLNQSNKGGGVQQTSSMTGNPFASDQPSFDTGWGFSV